MQMNSFTLKAATLFGSKDISKELWDALHAYFKLFYEQRQIHLSMQFEDLKIMKDLLLKIFLSW